jgi:hypothetical protein
MTPPLSLFSEAYGATVTFTGDAATPRMTIAIPANVIRPVHTFDFVPTESAAHSPG